MNKAEMIRIIATGGMEALDARLRGMLYESTVNLVSDIEDGKITEDDLDAYIKAATDHLDDPGAGRPPEK